MKESRKRSMRKIGRAYTQLMMQVKHYISWKPMAEAFPSHETHGQASIQQKCLPPKPGVKPFVTERKGRLHWRMTQNRSGQIGQLFSRVMIGSKSTTAEITSIIGLFLVVCIAILTRMTA
jgi:hypothetical protein